MKGMAILFGIFSSIAVISFLFSFWCFLYGQQGMFFCDRKWNHCGLIIHSGLKTVGIRKFSVVDY